MLDMLSFHSITPHLKHLRCVGFYQIDPNASKVKRYLHRTYMAFILFVNILYTGQDIARIFQVRDDADKIMDTMFLMLTYSDCIYKQVVAWKYQDRIEEMLNVLKEESTYAIVRALNFGIFYEKNTQLQKHCREHVIQAFLMKHGRQVRGTGTGPLFNQNEPDHRILLLKQGNQSKMVLRVFNLTALATCFLWVVFPTILYAQGKPVEFAIWLPFDPNMSPQFYIALGYVWMQTSLLAVGNTSMDVFISFFFAHCKTQLSILRLNLESIVKKCQTEARDTSMPFAKVFHKRFHNILLHYNEIVLLCKKTQSIFGGPILYFFLISAWINCTSAYKMLSINPISTQFLSMVLYIICVMTEVFLYCYYGNEVTYESEKLMESAFAMEWHEIPIEQRYPVIIFMERIKRPIVPVAGFLIPLSNNTLVSILRSSYTFYAFLKNTDK